MNKISIRACAAFLMLALYPLYLNGQSIEYSVKALFIEKFSRLTTLKSDSAGGFFVISVLGKNPFHGELEAMAKTVRIKNKPVRITYLDSCTPEPDCRVVFISASERSRLGQVLGKLDGRNILTISDTPGFCKKGVAVNFYIDESETVKFEINITSLRKSGLTVDIQLLSYAKILN